jgi:hypothetical protein
LARIEVGKGAEDAGGFLAQRGIGGIGANKVAVQRSSNFKMRLPDLALSEFASSGWVLLLLGFSWDKLRESSQFGV